jgi:hypothetical protein
MSQFAIAIWAWKLTGQTTALALMGVFSLIPSVVFSPFAGALVDRWNKKLVMALSDLAAVLTTTVILAIYLTGHLQIGHLYAAGFFNGIFRAFQFPAYSAAISIMVPKEHYARSSSMLSMAEMGSGILAPMLAGGLLAVTGLQWILIIDIVTFLFAISTIWLVKIQLAAPSHSGRTGKSRLWREIGDGFQYVLARPSLVGLLLIFFVGNFFASATFLGPMILSRTQNNTQILGLVSSVAGSAGVAGNLVVIAWGGPRRRIHGVICGWLAGGLLGVSLMGVNGGLPLWLAAGFCGGFIPAIIDASNQALWQAKVPLDLQGRVTSLRWLFALGSGPLAMLIAGPLTDRVMEPAMQSADGFLPNGFGWITGTGPGTGMAVMFLVAGLCIVAISLIAYAIPAIRDIDRLLPDHGPSLPARTAEQAARTGKVHESGDAL